MREKFIVRSVVANNGVRQVHMTHDVYRDEFSQPVEIMLNTQSDMFRDGDEWVVQMTLVSRSKEYGGGGKI
jgi:hypothetical protein